METDKSQWVYADFNGYFGDNMLCLSHSDTCTTRSGETVHLAEGMQLTAYDEDSDEQGHRDDLFASGTVIPAPDWAQCRGSKWFLQIDDDGLRWESDIRDDTVS